MKINGKGYLTTEAVEEAEIFLSPHLGVLTQLDELIEELIKFSSDQVVDSQRTDSEKQQAIALVAIARIVEISQAASLMMRHGMGNEVNSLFRVFLDAYFVFGNICSNPKFVPEYFSSDDHARLTLMNVSLKHKSEMFAKLRGYARTARDALKAKIAARNIERFKSERYAKNIGCQEIYDSMYRVSSSFVHSSPRSLAHYVEETKTGEINTLKLHPRLQDIPERAYDFCVFLINVYSGITELFGQLEPRSIEERKRKLDLLVVKE